MNELTLAKAQKLLSPKELETYQKYIESGKPPLSAGTASNFYALFLNGHSCDEIAKLNPSFGLGIILRARIDYDWDEQRLTHIKSLLDTIRQTVQTVQLGAVQFVADGVAAYHKMAGEKYQRYLQSGDEEDLGDLKGMSWKQYKDMLDTLLKLTGQDTQTKKVQGVVEHHHTMDPAPSMAGEAARINQPMSSADAHSFLQRMDKAKK